MKLKSFFADTVEQALTLARAEMGPDAMLVHSKRSGQEARHLGAYEVVCAAATEAATAPERSLSFRSTATMPQTDRLVEDVSELKQQMERLARSLARCGSGMTGIRQDPELAQAFATLAEADLDADLAYEIIGRIASPASPDALRKELREMVKVNADLGRPGAPRRTVALVGPPGCGKTSCLVKLAVEYGIAARRRTQLLTLDTHRVAAADELQSYASILGLGCQVLESPAALAQALEEHANKDLLLIDTPGLSESEMESYEDLARFIATTPDLDTHLVLSASMRTTDLKRAAERYRVFGPGKLLFTRLDETGTCGPMLGLSVRMGLPLSFLSRGQRIPEDLEAGSAAGVLDLILKTERAREPSFGMAAA